MATYIYVSNSGALLQRNQEDVARNRDAAARRRQLQNVIVQKAVVEQKAVPVDYAHRRRPLTAEEVSATGLQPLQPGHIWWFTKSEPVVNTGNYSGTVIGTRRNGDVVTGQKRTSRLYCGNGSQYVEVVHGQTPQQMIPESTSPFSDNFYACVNPENYTPNQYEQPVENAYQLPYDDFTRVVTLPAGRDATLVLFLSYQSSFAINTLISGQYPYGGPTTDSNYNLVGFATVQQSSLIRRCFIASNTRIREVSVPPTFAACLEELLPEPTTTTSRVNTAWRAGTTIYKANATLQNYGFGVDLDVSESAIGLKGLIAYPTTPGVFEVAALNSAVWNVKIGSIVKPFSETKSWLIEDTSNGAYTPANSGTGVTAAQLFGLDQPHKYGKWNTPNEVPTADVVDGGYEYDTTLYTPQSRRTFSMLPGRAAIPEGFAPYFADAFRTVWDWDDPTYCRQVCLELGFTTTDLVP